MRIFGFLVYIHVLEEKRSKLDPSGKKGIFVGYSESLKGYRIHILGLKKIEVSPNVTFDEDVAFKKSIQRHAYEYLDEEPVAPRVIETVAEDNNIPEGYTPDDHDIVELQRPVDPPREVITYKRILTWA